MTTQAAVLLLGGTIVWFMLSRQAPESLAIPPLLTLATASTFLIAASSAAARSWEGPFTPFAWGWFIAGALNLIIAVIQVFFPDAPDGTFIAHSSYPGRATGNLRQPNHLSSLLLWSCVATVGLFELKRITKALAAAAMAAFVFAVVLTASRTGLVSVVLLAVWGAFDRRLSRAARIILLAAPVFYAISWLGMAEWAKLSQHAFGGAARLAETDISSSRFAIWRDTLDLIRMNPWTGVGWGDFNFAWTLTPFPHRPTAFFDHTHNLPLQLAVELGLPLAALILGLLLWGLWQGARNAWFAPADDTGNLGARCAMVMVILIGLHSLLEYPLWYSYFLLPTAWAWGYALQPAAAGQATSNDATARPPAAWRGWLLPGVAVLIVIGSVFSVLDYWRVVVIFEPPANAGSLESRIASGKKSVFFGHHADYAEVTSGVPVADPEHAFDRVTHYLLDTRLMIAWAKSLAARGQVDEARYLAARLREFRKADAEEFFSVCKGAAPAVPTTAASAPASTAVPFQCEAPQRPHEWREFLAR